MVIFTQSLPERTYPSGASSQSYVSVEVGVSVKTHFVPDKIPELHEYVIFAVGVAVNTQLEPDKTPELHE